MQSQQITPKGLIRLRCEDFHLSAGFHRELNAVLGKDQIEPETILVLGTDSKGRGDSKDEVFLEGF